MVKPVAPRIFDLIAWPRQACKVEIESCLSPYWSRGQKDILRVLIYLAGAPLRRSVTLLGIRVFYVEYPLVAWNRRQLKIYRIADDLNMAQPKV